MTSSLGFVIFSPIIMICSIFGNILTITAVCKTRALRCRYAVRLITSLASCDLLFSLLSCPVNITTALLDIKSWESSLCTINGFLNVMLCLTSLLTLTAVSVDRYVAIVTPFRYRTWMSSERVKKIIAAKWTTAAMVAAVPLSGWGPYVFFPQKGFCFIDYHADVEAFFFLGPWFYIAFAVIAFAYYHIFKEARRQKKQIRALQVVNNNASHADDAIEENCGMNSTEASGYAPNNPDATTQPQYRQNVKRIKHESKAAVTIFAIIAAFLVCWLPFVLVNFTAALVDYVIPRWLDVASTLLVATGSMVNPFFYAWLDSSFRLAFTKLLSPILGRCFRSAPLTVMTQ